MKGGSEKTLRAPWIAKNPEAGRPLVETILKTLPPAPRGREL